jgi:putative Holliday junction resolvase
VSSTIITLEELPPNALRRKKEEEWIGGFSLGVDLGMARTGLALSKGYSVRPLTVTTIPLSFAFTESIVIMLFCVFRFYVIGITWVFV